MGPENSDAAEVATNCYRTLSREQYASVFSFKLTRSALYTEAAKAAAALRRWALLRTSVEPGIP